MASSSVLQPAAAAAARPRFLPSPRRSAAQTYEVLSMNKFQRKRAFSELQVSLKKQLFQANLQLFPLLIAINLANIYLILFQMLILLSLAIGLALIRTMAVVMLWPFSKELYDTAFVVKPHEFSGV
uniref:Uncharacterized protein n=1 Tax=Oryza punctata TaxID=4537 RepID=A0A0E0LPL0_ORYPU